MKLLAIAVFWASFVATACTQEALPEVVISQHPNGKTQVRAFDPEGTVAMDTVVDGHDQRLREVSDGKSLVRLMLSAEDKILDCQVDFEPKIVEKFLKQVLGNSLDADIASVAKSIISDDETEATQVSIKNLVTEKFNQMMSFAEHKTQCGMHHSSRRHRGTSARRLARSMFIYPGTNWCGSGNQDIQLGENIDTDKCCREHDNCPYYIESMQQKYGNLNLRLYTISHCACDEHFRTCLRLAGTESANQVGNWYFNLIELDCFIFRPKRVCEERAWYGKCLRYRNDFQAEVRSALEY
ncbi:hypothetical protein CAPTEDRAFT_177049 [Capitella teleta]|uniref:Phospholipase A2-like central domain-containing protein n=1 Tax=Capitella teleta TaxID=283909 RepID=R7USY7_CAPTE|nr:hypothetical protein CAPTEDRAFT_177049 [Capitella teleta]|eukprot:ELU07022.1 hypothetical protein CAPTEDRAFT_177049 [Capitella teleta]